MLKMLGDGILVGPLLLGTEKPAHILTPSVTSRGIINATALATVEAQFHESGGLDHVQGLTGKDKKTA